MLFSPRLQGWPPPGHLMPTANMGYSVHLPHHVRILHSAHYHGLSPLADSASGTCLSLVAESIAPDLAVQSTACPMARLPTDIDCTRNDSNNENNICFCYFYQLPTQCQAWHMSSHLILMTSPCFPHFTHENTKAQRESHLSMTTQLGSRRAGVSPEYLWLQIESVQSQS